VPARGTETHDTNAGVPEISVKELKQRMENGGLEKTKTLLLDVREPNEWEIAHINGAVLIPKDQVKNRLHELSAYDEILVQCRSGVRSADIARFLINDIGLKKVKNVRGGILAWAREIDPKMPMY